MNIGYGSFGLRAEDLREKGEECEYDDYND